MYRTDKVSCTCMCMNLEISEVWNFLFSKTATSPACLVRGAQLSGRLNQDRMELLTQRELGIGPKEVGFPCSHLLSASSAAHAIGARLETQRLHRRLAMRVGLMHAILVL